jgi:hypothetical protein
MRPTRHAVTEAGLLSVGRIKLVVIKIACIRAPPCFAGKATQDAWPPEITEEVSSHPGENGRWERKKASKQPCARDNQGRLEKSPCKSVEQAENHS